MKKVKQASDVRVVDEDKVKDMIVKDRKPKTVSIKDLLSSGSTTLNLSCSGKINGAYAKGKYIFFVGDSESGKTFIVLTCFAEACANEEFDNYRLIFDNAEDGALMDISYFFGKRVAQRLEPPAGTKEQPIYSTTIEDFYDNLDNASKRKRPFIYILDSMDALDSEQAEEKYQEQKAARLKGKESKGSYGDGKAKINSSNLRRVLAKMRASGSILIIINQTRDNLSHMGAEKTRSGGRALRFYATIEIWTSIAEKIRKPVKGEMIEIGTRCKVVIKKNRVRGRKRSVIIPIYDSYGIDDLGSCVEFLLEKKHWRPVKEKGKKQSDDDEQQATKVKKLRAPEFDFIGSPEKLIRYIEDNDKQDELRLLVAKVWNEFEASCSLKRKPRYE